MHGNRFPKSLGADFLLFYIQQKKKKMFCSENLGDQIKPPTGRQLGYPVQDHTSCGTLYLKSHTMHPTMIKYLKWLYVFYPGIPHFMKGLWATLHIICYIFKWHTRTELINPLSDIGRIHIVPLKSYTSFGLSHSYG